MEPINTANASVPLGAPHGQSGNSEQRLKEVSTAFEAIFMRQIISAMRQTVGEGGVLPKSNGQRMFEGMLDEEWSKKLAGGGGSLSQLLFEQLSKRTTTGEPGAGELR